MVQKNVNPKSAQPAKPAAKTPPTATPMKPKPATAKPTSDTGNRPKK